MRNLEKGTGVGEVHCIILRAVPNILHHATCRGLRKQRRMTMMENT